MDKKKILLIIFLVLLVISLTAQNTEFNKKNFSDSQGLAEATKNLKKGDEAFAQKSLLRYQKAVEFYLKANQFNPNNAMLNFKIGICFLNSNNKAGSLEYFLKAQNLNAKIDPKINFAIGQAYQYNLKFDEAIASFNTYLSNDVAAKDKALTTPQIEKRIKECENGKIFITQNKPVTITNLGNTVNSKYNDYSPLSTKTDSFIIFTSRRENTEGKQFDMETQEFYEDIYVTRKTGSDWSKPERLSDAISTTAHDAAVALAYNGQRLYIYKGQLNGGDIYETNLEGSTTWSAPRTIHFINTPYHESSACLSPDGKTVFVVSNNPEKTLGGHDIFVSRMNEDKTWTVPENLGSTINTPYEEEGVFIANDGKTLYFSSKGHNSMGGFDIFRTKLENGSWTTPENMGYPLNTPDDDLYCIAFGEEGSEEGYFSSERSDGQGEKDIYYFKFINETASLKNATDTTTTDTTFAVDLHKGEPSDAFATINGDGSNSGSDGNNGNINKNGTGNNNSNGNTGNEIVKTETGQPKDIITNDRNGDQGNNTGSYKSIEIPQQANVIFHVQVGAAHKPMPQNELKARYPGKMPVEVIQHEGWYKYLIGRYDSYSEARQIKFSCGTPDAWVVVYKNGVRVNIREVMDMVTYFPHNDITLACLFR